VKRRRLVYSLAVIIMIPACYTPPKSDFTFKNDLFKVSFETKPVTLIDANSYNGAFVLNGTDTFYYDVGFFISNLSESCKEVIYTKDSTELLNSSDQTVYVADKHYDVDKLRKRNIEFLSINGIKVKMVYPIDTVNEGLIGIYVDSLLNTKLGNIKMNLFSYKLKSTYYEEIKNSLRKVQFFQWDT